MGNQINNNVLVLYPVIIQGLKKSRSFTMPIRMEASPYPSSTNILKDSYA